MQTITDLSPEELNRLLGNGAASRHFVIAESGERLDHYAYRMMRRTGVRWELVALCAVAVCVVLTIAGLPAVILGSGRSSILVVLGVPGILGALLWLLWLGRPERSCRTALVRAHQAVCADAAQGHIRVIGHVDPAETDFVLQVLGRSPG